MAPPVTNQSVQCPKCKASYRLPENFHGNATCKKCGVSFSVGVSEKQRKAAQNRDAADKRTVKTMLFVGLGLLAAVGLILVAVGGGSGKPLDNHFVPPPAPTPPPRRPVAAVSAHPERVALSFLKALAKGDRAEVERLFDVDLYYLEWDGPTKNSTPDAERFDRLPPEEQAKRRALAYELIMDPEFGLALAGDSLIKWDSIPFAWSFVPKVEGGFGRFDLACRDEKTKPLVTLTTTVRPRTGMDPVKDGDRADAWAVSWIEWRWHQSTLKIAKADGRAIDPIEGRRKEMERKAMAGKPRGPIEADPVQVPEVEGTGPTQRTTIADSLKVLVDPASSGPKYNRARDELINLGRISIPFLLNTLVGKNHRDNDTDIKASFIVVQVLDEITGLGHFGYAPTQAKGSGIGVTTATSDERDVAVRRWFGWWSRNHKTWAGKPKPVDEPEEDKND